MSHLHTAAELKAQCNTTKDCEAYEAFIASEFKRYDTATNESITTIVGIGSVLGVIVLVVALAAFIPAIKRVVAKIVAIGLVGLPVIVLGLVAFGIGFGISFSACFKQSCGAAEQSAPFLLPFLSLIVSIPAAFFIKKRLGAIAAKVHGLRRSVWLILCAVLLAGVAGLTIAAIRSEQTYNATIKQELVRERWIKEASYIHPEPGRGTCLALMPECGYCPGEVIGNECYVQKQR